MAVPQTDQSPPRLALGLYKRFLLAALVIVMATSTAVATAALLEVKDSADIFERFSTPIAGITEENVLDDVDAGGPQTIIVLGSDRRFVDIAAKTPTRSDTIILLRLDPDRGATAVMSLPRDLRVDVPGYGRRKINEAYALGGPKLTVQTVRRLLGIPINHVVNVNFGGFQRAVNRLGCVYADVDRKYFNDNSGPGENYAVIDVPAGYQRLCGKAALEYVRYRHNDNDIVRGARQQDFLRQAKAQIGVSKLFADRKNLIEIFGRYTQTDIRGTNAILRLLKLTVESAKNPIQEVQIRDLEEDGADLVASPQAIDRAASDFLSAQATEGPRDDPSDDTSTTRKRQRSTKAKRGGIPAGLFEARRQAEDQAVPLDTKLDFPVYFPKWAVTGSTLRVDDHRAYDLYDRGRRRYRAYRMVVNVPGTGQNYGVQGTNWKAPPILDSPSETRTVAGRKLELHYDGDRLRLVAFRTEKAVYWISNTLLQVLTEKQMLGLAQSLTRVGGR
ncbi:MAG: LytR family transcriptional regulator [Solirubrobacterales bacterium]|jgi:LCP family protein required for cell wall assembly|nr:LytR family transcriptional regulator [Solirubrobacterales bacterium]